MKLLVTLYLPKRIINEAINWDQFSVNAFGVALSQVEFLFLLCSVFLFMVCLNCELFRAKRSGLPEAHAPLNVGFRFSTNAFTPSRPSSLIAIS